MEEIEFQTYDELSFSDLKELVEQRGVEVSGDLRSKKNLIAALEYQDALEESEETVAEAKEASPKSALEQQLEKMVPEHRITFGRDHTRSNNPINDDMKVGNLPAEYIHAWPNITLNQGEDLGRYLGLGWVRVTSDMVSTDPNQTEKLYVRNYEDYGGYVKYNDTTLVIANRRLVEERKADNLAHWNRKVEKTYGKRGELTKDRVGDPSHTSERSYKRTAQWKAEELLEGGN